MNAATLSHASGRDDSVEVLWEDAPRLELDVRVVRGVELADVEVAGVVVAFLTAKNAAHFPRTEQELELSGEFLVLIAGLLELKARGKLGYDLAPHGVPHECGTAQAELPHPAGQSI